MQVQISDRCLKLEGLSAETSQKCLNLWFTASAKKADLAAVIGAQSLPQTTAKLRFKTSKEVDSADTLFAKCWVARGSTAALTHQSVFDKTVRKSLQSCMDEFGNHQVVENSELVLQCGTTASSAQSEQTLGKIAGEKTASGVEHYMLEDFTPYIFGNMPAS